MTAPASSYRIARRVGGGIARVWGRGVFPGFARLGPLDLFSNAPGAFARKRAKAMQAGLPCRVRSLSLLGSPGGQMLDVVAAPFQSGRRRSLSIEGNAAGNLLFAVVRPALLRRERVLLSVSGLRGSPDLHVGNDSRRSGAWLSTGFGQSDQ